ncbi:hypothetical protein VTK73DRAFT_547 [Phialemonium thermophilum]|uniref:Uncharacterized protein n=1 Tax=Phialemonium thermophilum TaxID=223376 RepID=A0ABR3XEL3_9PEZI
MSSVPTVEVPLRTFNPSARRNPSPPPVPVPPAVPTPPPACDDDDDEEPMKTTTRHAQHAEPRPVHARDLGTVITRARVSNPLRTPKEPKNRDKECQ